MNTKKILTITALVVLTILLASFTTNVSTSVKTLILVLSLILLSVSQLIPKFSNISKNTSKTSTTKKCGKEGHFSHSSGGGTFSWNAIRMKNNNTMKNPYLFTMFETYRDGTSDHYLLGTIDLPSMTADVITSDGSKGIFNDKSLSYGSPDTDSLKTIAKAQKKFFDMLPCYSGSYSGKGTQ